MAKQLQNVLSYGYFFANGPLVGFGPWELPVGDSILREEWGCRIYSVSPLLCHHISSMACSPSGYSSCQVASGFHYGLFSLCDFKPRCTVASLTPFSECLVASETLFDAMLITAQFLWELSSLLSFTPFSFHCGAGRYSCHLSGLCLLPWPSSHNDQPSCPA